VKILLEAINISKRFGGLVAVDRFTMQVPDNSIVGIIGPNGAGKTTIFNMLTGVYRPSEGEIRFNGRVISGFPPHQITRLGIARTFQNIRLFQGMNVLNNVRVACGFRQQYSFFDALVHLPKVWASERQIVADAEKYLDFVGLLPYKLKNPDSLPYGLQRKLEIARALMTNPSVLLLDEPAAGLNPSEVVELMNLIHKLRKMMNLSIVLIEHHMEMVMSICNYVWVINFGKTIAYGTPSEVQCNPEVLRAYMGEECNKEMEDKKISTKSSVYLPEKNPSMTFLEAKSLNVSYGKIHVLRDVSIHLDKNEIVSIIGANGAGKSTLINTLSGALPYRGTILFNGKSLPRRASKVAALGIIQVPEGRRVFPGLTVEENLIMGGFLTHNERELKASLNRVYGLFPRLHERRYQLAGTLSGGEQQMLAIGRALMSNPKVLLLDEPSLGLAPIMINEIFELILTVRSEGTTILLVEQNAHEAMRISDRTYVMQTGEIIAEGRGIDLLNDPVIRQAYLGIKENDFACIGENK